MRRTVVDVVQSSQSVRHITPLDITVLGGGPGDEREVSLQSGRMVRDALKRLGHRAIMLDIQPEELAALDVPADVVFIALHGAFGEDGALQRILEERRFPFTGSDSRASALAMDKVDTKARLIEKGIPTPRFDLVYEAAAAGDGPNAIEPPLVVKPRASGSSVDTFVVRDRERWASALETVVSRYGAALVETYIDGPELTVGILGDRALPVCQIRTRREFYNYEAKYLDDDTEYLFDIDLPEALLCRVQSLSLDAHRALGCRGFSRVDWMIDRASLEPYVIELNTIPGLTSHSLLPKAAARAGLSFDDLCQTIVSLAVETG